MLQKLLAPQAERAYALLRIVTGLLFVNIGAAKVFGVASSMPAFPLGTQMGIGGLIELVGGLALVLGFWTSCAAFVLSGTMAVAYAQFHWKFAMDKGFFPSVNGGYAAAVSCFLFLYMACKGSGPWSLDARRKKAAGVS